MDAARNNYVVSGARSTGLIAEGAMNKTSVLLALLLASVTAAAADDDPVAARLRSARSLQCTYTSTVATMIRDGQRTTKERTLNFTVTFDKIDLAKGTARVFAGDPANDTDDLQAWWGRLGGLWLVEHNPLGTLIVTTIFPMYAGGTNDFVVLRGIQLTTTITIVAEEMYGTCKVIQ